ncbi:hypothetical protein [Staphylococcus pseudintermedius]|uniref:hypothetical protein n=1 Tax=Staphylococcus pseudintermedius TaxID=283734 RepID=UPI00291CB343|nr:hypothetical protein QS421_11815 [Staphylococcus pseudintermedius]
MKVSELHAHFAQYFSQITKKLLDGSYQPQAVRKVQIPKPNVHGSMSTSASVSASESTSASTSTSEAVSTEASEFVSAVNSLSSEALNRQLMEG